ncbi:hypothetical protein ACIOMM_03135 [Streptomyces sp. NPDC087908]|uniref:hypothetical protein n=1 Tax=unclassified Streptomyces TaxID=2593676 RepID=UPI0011CE9C85|nr:hypothetical protein [Streptomyces sp. adm13(2018)]TXS32000.1 hypothetical protein EAO70_00770 [Streptomyces sp. adm13(2018)]
MTLTVGRRVRLAVDLALTGQVAPVGEDPAEPAAAVGFLALPAGTEGTVEEVAEDRAESEDVREYARLASLLDSFGDQMPPASRTQLEERVSSLEPAWTAFQEAAVPVRVRVRLDNGFVLRDTAGHVFVAV